MRIATLIILCGIVLASGPAQAQSRALGIPQGDDSRGDDTKERRLEVIQNRKYFLRNEVSLLAGVLPGDAFYKGATGTLGYTYHFNDHIAWQVGQFTYSYNFDASLKDEVKRVALSTGVDAPDFPEIDWIAASHLVIKPFYGKEALFNTEVVHLELYFALGAALVHTTGEGFIPIADVSPGMDLGLGLRVWLTPGMSLLLDFGELLYLAPAPERRVVPGDGSAPRLESRGNDFEQALHVRLGLSFTLGGGL
ncbi:MAG: outer membrane beta-barrel domain-containing protein [Myxococcota bacterium]